MNKIIVAFDGLDLSTSALEYAVHLAKSSQAHLIGIFLDDFTYHSYHYSEIVAEDGAISTSVKQELDDRDEDLRSSAVQLFKDTCAREGIDFSVHRDRNVALQELLHETIYSDLLIISSRETFTRFDEKLPTNFLRDLLTDAQCPVLVVPDKYQPIDKLVFLYDGAPSSVHAIKMFDYAFPEMRNLQAEVLTIKMPKEPLHVPDARLMKEFMQSHYPNAEYVIMKGRDEKTEITNYLNQQQEGMLVVLGAYQRSRASRLFRPSMADRLMAHTQIPLFIAHNK